ncbi:hypothetical protein ACSX1A_17310 [Pontibacter sp. MBLB2868]|uniref:hypothetical protein n=1 Tax=Pontibacter sp. MBLB2868 TaxID=3451555 RepID=UPI003F756E88
MPDSAWVTVKVKDEEGGNAPMPLTIVYGCQKMQTQQKQASFKVRRLDNKHQLKVAALGYLTVETMPFDFSKGDSVVVDFVLGEDDRPLVNCEGIH